MAAEKAKDAVAPPVVLLGLRKNGQGFEVVRMTAPATSTMEVISPAEPLGFAAQGLLRAIRSLMADGP